MDDELFRQLERGMQKKEMTLTVHDEYARIPADPSEAAFHAWRVIDYASQELADMMSIVGNILRWHGGEVIRERSQDQKEWALFDAFMKLLEDHGYFSSEDE